MKIHYFIHDHLMVLLNYMVIGLQRTIENLMICLMLWYTLFNHESERRGIEFVTRKITDGVAKIHLGIAR